MILDEYKTVQDKEPFFKDGSVLIDINLDQIFDRISEFEQEKGSWIYRGCSEARHRLYSSAQRFYMGQDLHKQVPDNKIIEHYKKFITELISSCKSWNNGVVKKLLAQSGIDENNDLAYLSYMQHFGVPTPLLDFTFNPYVALFFAVDNINFIPSNNEIDNYFSLYYTYKEQTMFESWKYVFDTNLEKKGIQYDEIDRNNMSILLPDQELYKIINSVNIINQQGLFFYNNHPWYPLEHTYKEHADFTIEEIGREKFDQIMMLDTVAGCFNIHKSLVPAIKRRLLELGITKSYIYPDMNNFRSAVTDQGIYNSLTLNK